MDFSPTLSARRSPAPARLLGLVLLACTALAASPVAASASARASARVSASAQAQRKKSKPVRRRARACRPSRRRRCLKQPAHRHPTKRPVIPPRAPGAATRGAQLVTGTAATLLGAVNPGGHAATYWFQYGTGTWYGRQTATQSAGASRAVQPVSTALEALSPLQTYHFRIVASSCHGCSSGTAYGADMSFTTGGYTNSVFGTAEAADPFVLDNGGGHRDYWAFTTGNLFPLLHSTDLVHWTSAGTAMTARPAWALQSGDWHPWAPHAVESNESCPGASSPSCYVMYYVSVSARFSANCVAVATSPTPGGPYTDQGPLSNGTLDVAGRPIGCGDNAGYGMIDPSVFVDRATGRHYLYASEDFACPPASASCTATNSHLQPTISVIPLANDYLSATGPRTPLFSGAPGSWESADVGVPTVEGPTAMLHDATYYILYSGGNWRSRYGMGYATAPSPTGPFTKAPANPILSSVGGVLGPGGADTPVVGPGGSTWLVYHARQSSYGNPRTLWIDPFSWRTNPPGPDAPVIDGPSDSPEPNQP